MKKVIKLVFLIIVLAVIAILSYFLVKYYNIARDYMAKEDEEIRIYEENKEKEEEEKKAKEEKDQEYKKFLDENVYNNTIPIGIYTIQNGQKVLTREFYCDWSRDSIFALFYAIASDEEVLPNTNFESLFNECWNDKENSENYKIGYNIKFSLDTGEVINKRILNPEDTDSLFEHIQFYLYDDITYMPGRPYYHMRQYEMTDETMLTSVKLVGYKETKGVNGPIELTVFTYDGEEDFDEQTGEYLGNSKFTTKIYREQV